MAVKLPTNGEWDAWVSSRQSVDTAWFGLRWQTFYCDQCRLIAVRHCKATAEFYAGPERFRHEPFWMARASRNPKLVLGPAPTGPFDATTLVRLSTDSSLNDLPCLVGDRICLLPTLSHPNLDGPVSHLGNVAVAALLNGTTEARTAGEVCNSWARKGLAQRPLPLLHWFLKNGIITPIHLTA